MALLRSPYSLVVYLGWVCPRAMPFPLPPRHSTWPQWASLGSSSFDLAALGSLCRSTWPHWIPFACSSFDVAALGTLCLFVTRCGGVGLPLPARRSKLRLWASGEFLPGPRVLHAPSLCQMIWLSTTSQALLGVWLALWLWAGFSSLGWQH